MTGFCDFSEGINSRRVLFANLIHNLQDFNSDKVDNCLFQNFAGWRPILKVLQILGDLIVHLYKFTEKTNFTGYHLHLYHVRMNFAKEKQEKITAGTEYFHPELWLDVNNFPWNLLEVIYRKTLLYEDFWKPQEVIGIVRGKRGANCPLSRIIYVIFAVMKKR